MRIMYGVALLGMLLVPSSRAQAVTADHDLIKVEHEWKQAVIDRDVPALQRLYGDDYLGIDAEGMVWTKAQDIEIDTSGPSRMASFKLEDLTVRTFGDVAVVAGQNTTRGSLDNVAAVSRYRFTDVFVKRDGRWQLVSSHFSTPVATGGGN